MLQDAQKAKLTKDSLDVDLPGGCAMENEFLDRTSGFLDLRQLDTRRDDAPVRSLPKSRDNLEVRRQHHLHVDVRLRALESPAVHIIPEDVLPGGCGGGDGRSLGLPLDVALNA